jgi:FMN phosphatase YigB (HAD superfamily)
MLVDHLFNRGPGAKQVVTEFQRQQQRNVDEMRAQDFIRGRPTNTLTIFDIDDTLFHTTAKIKVVKNGQVIRSLTNQEFNNYQLRPGEEFDFGEFRDAEKFRQESKPIDHMLEELKTILSHTQGKVIMLTARADFDDKETFLKKFKDHGIDMSRIHVHRAGNLPGTSMPADKKAVWVRRYLDTGRYDQVSLYDDSVANLRVFKSLKKEYPQVQFDAYHITPDQVAALEGVTENSLIATTPDPVVVISDLKGKHLDTLKLSVAVQKYKLGSPQNIKNQLTHQDFTKIGNYSVAAPMGGQPVQGGLLQGVVESDISGLMAAARDYNKVFVITAELAEGGVKKFKVRAQSERAAREKFLNHYRQAQILKIQDITDVAEAYK